MPLELHYSYGVSIMIINISKGFSKNRNDPMVIGSNKLYALSYTAKLHCVSRAYNSNQTVCETHMRNGRPAIYANRTEVCIWCELNADKCVYMV